MSKSYLQGMNLKNNKYVYTKLSVSNLLKNNKYRNIFKKCPVGVFKSTRRKFVPRKLVC